MSDTDVQPKMFDLLGGAEGIAKIVDSFYAYMDRDAEAAGIRALHPADLTRVTLVLKEYLGEWTGGPPLFSTQYGHPRMKARHMRFPIGEAERDAWMTCMTKSLADHVPNDQVRAAFTKSLYGLADWMRNRQG